MAEADERGGPQLGGEHAHRLGDVVHVFRRQVPQLREVGAGADGVRDDGADARLDVEVDADGLEGDDDVAEVDRGVDPVPAVRAGA